MNDNVTAPAGTRAARRTRRGEGDDRPRRTPHGRRRAAGALAAVVALAVLSGCGGGTGGGTKEAAAPAGAPPGATPDASPDVAPNGGPGKGHGRRALPAALPTELPGLGPRTLAEVPAGARQAVVVTGAGHDSNRSTAVFYERADDGWKSTATWTAHNAKNGWSDRHHVGDLRSPIGVFGLTDAGGRLPDPGTRLPYDHGTGFTAHGTGFEGESLAGAFDYVVAINYNRKPGTTPLDWTRPLGANRGGGIWFHVDHGGPTQGCVSLSEEHMKRLLRTLDPDRHPIVVMGDRASLAR